MKRLLIILLTLIVGTTSLKAQHTFGITGGSGIGMTRFYPIVEGKSVSGLMNFGVSWRSYTSQKVVGCFGIDLEFMQRGFSYSPNASTALEGEELYYYERRINTIMVPIVWQPHFYIFDHRVRVFGEAAVTFSYDISSTYDNDYARQLLVDWEANPDTVVSGTYEYKTARDNRLGYGLAGGGGIAYLKGRIEVLAKARFYFGLSDVVRNRNKYYSNNNDGYENPFGLTPIRSSLNNLYINVGVNYHIGREGFDSWYTKRVKVKMEREFNYKGETKGASQQSGAGNKQRR